MNKFVFLDLEGTVISDIFDPVLCNIQKVKDWLHAEGKPEYVAIFSFAIDNDDESSQFRNGLAKHLEQALDVKIGRVVTTEHAQVAARQKNRVSFENLGEFKQLWGKERGFIDFAKINFTNCEVVLLDDLVDNCEVYVKDKNLNVRTVNINTLFKECL